MYASRMAGMMSAAQASHVYVCSTKLQSDFVISGIGAIPSCLQHQAAA
jgi:hypothetical protein